MRILTLFLLCLSCSHLSNFSNKRELANFDKEKCFALVRKFHLPNLPNDPAALELRAIIYRLYPDLPPDFLDLKLSVIDSDYKLFRSFVSLYYQLLQEILLELDISLKLLAIRGRGLGDHHLGNFGFLLTKKNELIFSANDPDNGSVISLYAEFLHYLTSLYLHNKNISNANIAKVIKAYKKGLAGENIPLAGVLKKVQKKAKKTELGATGNDLISGTKLKRQHDDYRISVDINAGEKERVETFIKSHFGAGTKVLDSFKFLNVIGGSGGYQRYRFLIELEKQSISKNLSTLQVIEFKEIQPHIIHPMAADSKVDMHANLALMTAVSKDQLSRFYGVLDGLSGVAFTSPFPKHPFRQNRVNIFQFIGVLARGF